MTNDQQVDSSVWIPVPPEEAFLLMTEPRRLRRWLIVAGTLDVRVGGPVHLVVAPGAHAVGRVTTVEPNRRLVYTHGWLGDEELPPGSSTVDVTLDPEHGGTRITVRHGGLPPGYADMADGWNDFLDRLVRTVAGEHNGHDWDETETGSDTAVLESSLYTLLSTFRRLEATPGNRPTDSTSFTVDGLADHLIQNAQWLRSILDGSSELPGGSQEAAPADSTDRESNVAEAIWPIVHALTQSQSAKVIDLGGYPVSVGTVVKYLSVEFLVHAWDLAHAADLELDASPALLRAVLRNCQETRGSLFFTAESYEPARRAGATDPLGQLLELTGRTLRG